MITVTAIVRNGQLELAEPLDLPDGTEVEIRMPGPPASDAGPEGDGPMTPEEIARMLAAIDRVEPFEMTEAEYAALEADRQARRAWENEHFDQHADSPPVPSAKGNAGLESTASITQHPRKCGLSLRQ